jgi:hypothetical protein
VIITVELNGYICSLRAQISLRNYNRKWQVLPGAGGSYL